MPDSLMTQDQIVTIIRKSWAEPDFRAKLVAAPRNTLEAEGIAIPTGLTLRIVEDTPNLLHLPLPARPEGEVTDEDLGRLAAAGPFMISLIIRYIFRIKE